MKKVIAIVLIAIFGILTLCIFGYYLLIKSINIPDITVSAPISINENVQNSLLEENLSTQSNYSYKITGWIPMWDFSEGFNSLKANPDKFYSISPVYFQAQEDGSIKTIYPNQFQEFQEFCKNNNIKVIPTITSFDSDLIKSIVSSDENINRQVEDFMTEVDNYNFDGIDIDYESIETVDGLNYMKLLSKLSEELHNRNKILSVSVISKWGDNISYTSLPQTRNVQDWEELGKYADEIRIMAYDYTPQSSLTPGPIAPIDWQKRILAYAETKLPDSKIWLGQNLYSYEWEDVSYNQNDNSATSSGKANSYTYDRIKTIINNIQNPSYSEIYAEGFAQYPCISNTSLNCIMYYPTPESINKRFDLISEFQVAGIAFWRVGREEELF